ncbi:MAG: hypothetical protein ACXVA9_09430 [Bdellovibrionales bacterium]
MFIEKLIKECDLDLREGRGHLIAGRIQQLTFANLDRRHRLPLAVICRRAGLFRDGIKLLTYLVHANKTQWGEGATIAEKAEYAVLLMKYGSVGEAQQILSEISPAQLPEISLYRAFCNMVQWNYPAAVTNIKIYLQTQPEEYAAIVARVNLASSCIAVGDLDQALSVLEENITLTKLRGYSRLLANSFELRAQVHLRARNFSACRKDVEASQKILGLEKSSDQLFVAKWKAILEAFESKSVSVLKPIQEEAEKRGHWESLRDLDRFSLQIKIDEKIYHRLVFGTPFVHFREMIFAEAGRRPERDIYLYGPELAPRLTTATGEIKNCSVSEVNGQGLAVLSALTRDFYRPTRLSELFDELFPGYHFDIFSSPNRVLQAVRRTRKWLEENKLPLTIEFQADSYRLVSHGPFAFEVGLERSRVPEIVGEKLWRSFGAKRFTANEAVKVLEISRQKFQRWFQKAEEEGQIEKIYSGAATEYKLRRTG